MHICFLSTVGVVGGAERVMLAWARAVREWDPPAEVSAVLLGDGPLRGRLVELGANVAVVPLPPSLAATGDASILAGRTARPEISRLVGSGPSAVRFVSRLRDVVKSCRPDLIHSNGLKTHLLAPLVAPRRTPVVWHLHDFYSERPIAKWALRFTRRGAAGGIAISDAVRRDAARLLPGFPVRTVRNTVDTEHFAPGPSDPARLDDLAGLPPAPSGTIRVGLVATYANWKGHGVFLEAFGRLPASLPVRGYIVGGPIYATAGSQVTRAELERQSASLGQSGRVGFIPFQADTADVYRALDVVVHASTRAEPFGLTIAEAMGCGRAVIVASAGGAVELFRDGHDGLGHPPGDTNALAGILGRLAIDRELRARLGQNARNTAQQHFSQRRLATQIAAVYHRYTNYTH